MKVIHISDVHIRNLKYHDEYRRVFEAFYSEVENISPDFVVNTGDTAHAKVQISPEFVQLCSEHIMRVGELAPYHILLGNHDLNLMNPGRQDAISPIVNSVQNSSYYPIYLHKKSGRFDLIAPEPSDVTLWIYSCADSLNFPTHKDIAANALKVNIGLYHGAIRSCETDQGFVFDEADADISLFKGLDYVFMGDIHKHQFLDANKRIAYAGSLIQQNFGESVNKGFVLWNINNDGTHSATHVPLAGSRKFYTVNLPEDLSIPEQEIEEGSRVRVIAPRSYTLSEKHSFERKIKDKYRPYDVISMPWTNVGNQSADKIVKNSLCKIENLRDISVQEKMIRVFMKDKTINNDVMNRILDINKRLQIYIEKEEETIRDVYWKLNSVAWSNMFNYGEGNAIDFEKLRGITGVFAPNSSGKSSIIDVILESIFDKTTKDISKNIHLVNDNKETASMIANITIDDGTESYVIERKIEKIKYGQRKLDDTKEWGKTSVNFYRQAGTDCESLNGILRPETEKSIRKHFGTFDDFVLTSLLTQDRDSDITKKKDTERRKILSKFMDLDIFEQKEKLAKEEARDFYRKLKELENIDCEGNLLRLHLEIAELEETISAFEREKEILLAESDLIKGKIFELESKIVDIGNALDIGVVEKKKQSVILSWHTKNAEMATLKAKKSQLIALRLSLTATAEAKPEANNFQEFQKRYSIIKNSLVDIGKKIEDYKNEISTLDVVPCGTAFPTCKFLTSAIKKRQELPELLNNESELTKELTTATVELNLANEQRLKNEKYESQLEEIRKTEQAIIETDLKIENMQFKLVADFETSLSADKDMLLIKNNLTAITENAEIESEIRLQRESLRKVNEKEKVDNTQLVKAYQLIGSKKSLADSIENELKELNELKITCDAYEFYTQAMGKDGVAYKILIEKLPLINDEVNKILSSVADFSVWIENDEGDQAIRVYLEYDGYKPRPLELSGGAEKFLSAIAIRVALLNITNLPKTNIFMIDEGFGSLDQKNIESMNKMFDYLRTMFDTVLVISHIDIMKDMVDNIIDISFDKQRYSHIEII